VLIFMLDNTFFKTDWSGFAFSVKICAWLQLCSNSCDRPPGIK